MTILKPAILRDLRPALALSSHRFFSQVLSVFVHKAGVFFEVLAAVAEELHDQWTMTRDWTHARVVLAAAPDSAGTVVMADSRRAFVRFDKNPEVVQMMAWAELWCSDNFEASEPLPPLPLVPLPQPQQRHGPSVQHPFPETGMGGFMTPARLACQPPVHGPGQTTHPAGELVSPAGGISLESLSRPVAPLDALDVAAWPQPPP